MAKATGGLHKLTVQEAENAQLGQGGYKFGASGSAVEGVEYVAITALSAAQVDTTSKDTALFPNLTNLVIPVGTTIYGRWSTIVLDSGTIMIYRG